MSQKHTVNNKREEERVLETGRMFVRKNTKCIDYLGTKISENGLIAGVIEITRGFGNHGDKDIKKCVISSPYSWTYDIDPTLECIILATEGLWQALRYDIVVDIVTQVIKSICL
jgi:serine/threonine protein phosphatase PrpC